MTRKFLLLHKPLRFKSKPIATLSPVMEKLSSLKSQRSLNFRKRWRSRVDLSISRLNKKPMSTPSHLNHINLGTATRLDSKGRLNSSPNSIESKHCILVHIWHWLHVVRPCMLHRPPNTISRHWKLSAKSIFTIQSNCSATTLLHTRLSYWSVNQVKLKT